jgi:hypothetical protein
MKRGYRSTIAPAAAARPIRLLPTGVDRLAGPRRWYRGIAAKEPIMNNDASGWLWFAMEVIMPILLLGALVYGTIQWRRRPRDPALERNRDQATRENYRQDEARSRG